VCNIYKGDIGYSAEVGGLLLKEPIDVEPLACDIEHPDIEKIILGYKKEEEKDIITLEFHTVNVKTTAEVQDITMEYAENIFSALAFLHNTSVGTLSFVHASVDIFNKDGGKGVSIMPAPLVITGMVASIVRSLGKDDIDTLCKELQHKGPERALYRSLYRFAFEITEPIAHFMLLYGIILLLTGGKQKKVDNFICENEKGVLKKPTRVPEKTYNETIYTYLRNEIGHPPIGKKLEDTRKEIKQKTNGLASLVKAAIQQFS